MPEAASATCGGPGHRRGRNCRRCPCAHRPTSDSGSDVSSSQTGLPHRSCRDHGDAGYLVATLVAQFLASPLRDFGAGRSRRGFPAESDTTFRIHHYRNPRARSPGARLDYVTVWPRRATTGFAARRRLAAWYISHHRDSRRRQARRGGRARRSSPHRYETPPAPAGGVSSQPDAGESRRAVDLGHGTTDCMGCARASVGNLHTRRHLLTPARWVRRRWRRHAARVPARVLPGKVGPGRARRPAVRNRVARCRSSREGSAD